MSVQTNFHRVIGKILVILLMASRLAAQTPLEYFTSQANAALQAQFGFGLTNIPVYCATNPAAGYSAAIHYVLQSAANAYDATTPATNFPSVFRPTFAWQGDTLLITGYTCVSNGGYSQVLRGFKSLTNTTITTDDNVWGIPWVIGAKDGIPAFNEYCYASSIYVNRELQFVRYPSPSQRGQYNTARPPEYTNQFYFMSISNAFGVECWNYSKSPYTNGVTWYLVDIVSIRITNNYNFGLITNIELLTNGSLGTWPGWPGQGGASFVIPLKFDTTILPYCYWSESAHQFVPVVNGIPGFFPGDTNQSDWPIHDWSMTISNNLVYALFDSNSGSVLDFENLGEFGSAIDFNAVLTNLPIGGPSPWIVQPSTDESNSPISVGDLNQIDLGFEQSPAFFFSLNGLPNGYPATTGVFYDPYNAVADFIQYCSWQSGNPRAHYTVQDLENPPYTEVIYLPSPLGESLLPISLTSGVCTLGEVNLAYNSGQIENSSFNLSSGTFQLGFTGAADLPYQIWASSDLVDWAQIGTAAQSNPGVFQFDDAATTNYPQRFYQVRIP